jgi:hypothetical protein
MPNNKLLQTGHVFRVLNDPLGVIPNHDPDTLFVVTGTEMSGGGTGHGPGDVYPDGHGVTAQRITTEGWSVGKKVFFRQSGCFTNLLLREHVELVGDVTVVRYCFERRGPQCPSN